MDGGNWKSYNDKLRFKQRWQDVASMNGKDITIKQDLSDEPSYRAVFVTLFTISRKV